MLIGGFNIHFIRYKNNVLRTNYVRLKSILKPRTIKKLLTKIP